jgi:GAF domain-containing protein
MAKHPDRDLGSQLEGLFSDLSETVLTDEPQAQPARAAGVGEFPALFERGEESEALLEEAISSLLWDETELGLMGAAAGMDGVTSGAPVLTPPIERQESSLLGSLAGMSDTVSAGALGAQADERVVSPLPGAREGGKGLDRVWSARAIGVAGAAVLVLLLVLLLSSVLGVFTRGFPSPSGVYVLYWVACALSLVVAFAQWMGNRSLVRALQAAERQSADTVSAQAGLYEQVDELVATNAALQKRTLQLQAATRIAQALTAARDPDDLMQRAVDLIRERFDLYYVGLFLIEEVDTPGDGGSEQRDGGGGQRDGGGEPGDDRRWAVLRAGTGEAGRRQVLASASVAVGDDSPVGWCAAKSEPRIAPVIRSPREGAPEGGERVGLHLPEARSEIALPLRSRRRVIGVLDAQSRERDAFSEDDVDALQAVADHLTAALQAALQRAAALAELEARLSQVEDRPSGMISFSAHLPSYERVSPDVVPLGQALAEASSTGEGLGRAVRQAVGRRERVVQVGEDGGEGEATLVVPITLRDQVLGALGLQQIEGVRQWTDDEVALVEAIVDQMALAIENARLLEQTRQRAERERLTADIATRVRASTDVDTILRTAVRELGRALRASDGLIRLQVVGESDAEHDTARGGHVGSPQQREGEND